MGNVFGRSLTTQSASVFLSSADQSEPPQWTHDVFLSFRGEDTRKSFISHLYHELHDVQQIKTFKDDRQLEIGTNISSELLRAIQDSRLAIVVLSPNYATSTWCLDELSNILRCMGDKARVLPIFYDVEPSDVRHQRGSFDEAFAKHKTRFRGNREMVTQWSAALTQVANLSGFPSKENDQKFDERKLIEDIVKWVRSKVHRTFTLLESTEFVGSDSRLEQINLLLASDEDDVRFIGICGIGGIGKTTTAKLIYDNISHRFEVSSFLANVREVSTTRRTLVDLQKILLLPILKEEIYQVLDELSGTYFTKSCFRNKKVLLVLDDVNASSQLKILAGEKDWFGKGSKIIITTRDERLLVDHGVDILHKVEVLNEDEALVLFSRKAFKRDEPDEGFLALSQPFLHYARGHPLALKTLGSSLFMRGVDAWNSVLDNMKKIPNPTIFDSLKRSYDALEETEKICFLDIACLYKGMDKKEIIARLDRTRDISSRILIDILVEKCLLEHKSCNIEMHDLIQEMAFTIEKSKEPDKRTRLWEHNEIFHIVMNKTGTEVAIEAISLRFPQLEKLPQWSNEAFCNMPRLKLLEFSNVILSSGPVFLPSSLRIIDWSWYPSKVFPTRFQPLYLTELNMTDNKLVQLWDDKKDFPNLKYMDLTWSNELVSTPDFSGVLNLENLNFRSCKKLVKIHPSIALLKRLKLLDFGWCESLESLPREIEMDSLDDFNLTCCSNLKKIPEFAGNMKNLGFLRLSYTGIEKIPASIERLVGLTGLYLSDCKNLMGLPSEICKLKSLTELNVRGCSKLEKLPENLGNLESLEDLGLEETAVRELPASLVRLKNLRYPCVRELVIAKPLGLVLPSLDGLCSLEDLDLEACNIGERGIPDDIGCLSSLVRLNLSGNNFVSLPASIRCLSKLCSLNLRRCKSLEELPDLPPNSGLHVLVDDCTCLKRLSDPSKWSSSFGSNLYDFTFTCLNCIRLVEDEDTWTNRIFSSIIRMANQRSDVHRLHIVSPGSEIPAWFNNQSVGDSLKVELPPIPSSCKNWMGIAFCVVFEDATKFKDPAARYQFHSFGIRCLSGGITRIRNAFKIGHLESEHHWVFYLPRYKCEDKQFLFETYYNKYYDRPVKRSADSERSKPWLITVNKCGARLVYKEDLRKFNRKLQILKPTHEYFCEEAITKRCGSFDDKEESSWKRLKLTLK